MTKLMLVLVATMFVSVASFAEDTAPAAGAPAVENAPAGDHAKPAKKEMKKKKAKKGATH